MRLQNSIPSSFRIVSSSTISVKSETAVSIPSVNLISCYCVEFLRNASGSYSPCPVFPIPKYDQVNKISQRLDTTTYHVRVTTNQLQTRRTLCALCIHYHSQLLSCLGTLLTLILYPSPGLTSKRWTVLPDKYKSQLLQSKSADNYTHQVIVQSSELEQRNIRK